MYQAKYKNKFSFLCAAFSFSITILRFIMAIISFLYLLRDENVSLYFPIYIIILIMIFDQIDGVLFKKSILNDSEFWKNCRRILDSVCDRLCIQLFCIPILFIQPNFIVIYIIIICKELLTSINCIRAYNNSIILSSNTMGKISCVTIGITVIMWLLHLYFIAYCIAPTILITGYISYKNYFCSYKNEFNDIE